MITKKNIIIAAAISFLTIGINAVLAQDTNSLLQMDVKKSSATDTVDVTFYTTADMPNSVVTRKANNRYVVLLPNVSSTSSVAPGFGGVKDLITDIDVKHVDDGIGGYTKVTFGTTKPINIKTHMKKTQPLTQAQKDYKAIIAKNMTPAKTTTQTPAAKQQVQPAVTKQQVQPTPANTSTQAVSATAQSAVKLVNNIVKKVEPQQKTTPAVQKTVAKNTTPAKVALAPKAVEVKKTEPVKPVQPKVTPVQPKVEQPAPSNSSADSYTPKMKFDENGKRMIDLEPRVSHAITSEAPANTKFEAITPLVDEDVMTHQEQVSEHALVATSEDVAVDTPTDFENKTSSKFPLWILSVAGSIVALGILYLIFDAIGHASNKDETRLKSFFKMSSQNAEKRRRRREYSDIVDNDKLSWQEKYKLYSEKEEKRKINKEPMDMSYITDMAGVRKAIIEPEGSKDEVAQKSSALQDDFKNKFSEKMQAKISQMEHALAQTPSTEEVEFVSNEVKSEDNAIVDKISDIKLKSFSKPMSLKESNRATSPIAKKATRSKNYKEGRFVKLKNSPLSVSKRNNSVSNLNSENKYLTNNYGEMDMNKQSENYLLSSLDEYLSILDSEVQRKSTPAGSLSQLKSSTSSMSRAGATNPIGRASNSVRPGTARPYMNGLIVKSGYNIDSEKGFYVVNIDGVSALVGRIKDNIFVLKKFDQVIDTPIQVRPDDGSVYIVKVGRYKCLVDVSQDKMGTLIEI